MKFFKKLFAWVSKLFNKVEHEVRKNAEIAIGIVEGVKTVINSPVTDVVITIVKKAIPGEKDNVLIDKVLSFVREKLPKILLQLRLIDSIANVEDTEEQLKLILNEIKFTSKEAENAFYHSLGVMIVEAFSDGELSWSESVHIAEFIYTEKFKK